MIKYTLKCSQDHRFESWFQSSGAYDKLRGAGLVICTQCGDTEVKKTIMAPRVQTARGKADVTPAPPQPDGPPPEVVEAITKMRDYVEKNSTDVGARFADEARAMYLGETPERMIHGQTAPEEAKALIEEGVPVVPLPFMPKRDVN